MFPKDAKSQALIVIADAKDPLPGFGTLMDRTKCHVRAVYDFAVQGGAVGSLNLLDDQGNPCILPQGAIVTNVVLNVITAGTTSASGTLSLGLLTATDLLAATAAASITGFLAGVPVGTAATWKGPVTSQNGSQITAAIATGALTAGKFYANIEYVINKLT